jgi:hypothetical protein
VYRRKLICGFVASQKIDDGTEEIIIERFAAARGGRDGAARADARILAFAADVAAARA